MLIVMISITMCVMSCVYVCVCCFLDRLTYVSPWRRGRGGGTPQPICVYVYVLCVRVCVDACV